MRTFYTWLCIFTTVCAAAAGDVLVALAMRRIGDLDELRRRHGFFAIIIRISSSGVLFGGVFFMAIAFFSNLIGLSWADLSVVGPASAALTFVTNALAARFFLHENVDRRRWLTTVCVCFGVLLLTWS
ncbi:MAG: EamA family transporter [Candidatus Sulfotelmatobacter sp.]